MELTDILTIAITIILALIASILVAMAYQFYKISILVRSVLRDMKYTTKFIKQGMYSAQTGVLKTLLGFIRKKGGENYEE